MRYILLSVSCCFLLIGLTKAEKVAITSTPIEFCEAGHGFGGEDAKKATEAMVAWFKEHLKK